jgi:hypothetical protein
MTTEAEENLIKAVDAFMPLAQVAFLWTPLFASPHESEVDEYRKKYWAVKKVEVVLAQERRKRKLDDADSGQSGQWNHFQGNRE